MVLKALGTGITALFCAFFLSSCATQTPVASLPTAEPDAQSVLAGYKLGSGDRVRISTFDETSLSGEFQVNSAGVISFPLLGDIPASGVTSRELQDKLVATLKQGYLLDPRVTVEVLDYRPFYILGEVNEPNSYPYSTGLTINNAVAMAKGFTYRADSRRVFVKHAGEAQETEYRLTSSAQVAPGDTVRIAERYF